MSFVISIKILCNYFLLADVLNDKKGKSVIGVIEARDTHVAAPFIFVPFFRTLARNRPISAE
jgi:hypothetical protein